MKLKILKSLTKRTESLLSLISLNSLSSLFRSRQPYNFAFCILHYEFISLPLWCNEAAVVDFVVGVDRLGRSRGRGAKRGSDPPNHLRGRWARTVGRGDGRAVTDAPYAHAKPLTLNLFNSHNSFCSDGRRASEAHRTHQERRSPATDALLPPGAPFSGRILPFWCRYTTPLNPHGGAVVPAHYLAKKGPNHIYSLPFSFFTNAK